MRFFTLVSGALLILVMGCAHTSGSRLPDSDRSASSIYYVENHGDDDRHLELIVAELLRERGLKAAAGSAATRPPDAEYLVTYEDRWYWDMRLYLLRFTIRISDAKTGEILGFGDSYQDSLAAMGLTHKDVIERAVNELLGPQ